MQQSQLSQTSSSKLTESQVQNKERRASSNSGFKRTIRNRFSRLLPTKTNETEGKYLSPTNTASRERSLSPLRPQNSLRQSIRRKFFRHSAIPLCSPTESLPTLAVPCNTPAWPSAAGSIASESEESDIDQDMIDQLATLSSQIFANDPASLDADSDDESHPSLEDQRVAIGQRPSIDEGSHWASGWVAIQKARSDRALDVDDMPASTLLDRPANWHTSSDADDEDSRSIASSDTKTSSSWILVAIASLFDEEREPFLQEDRPWSYFRQLADADDARFDFMHCGLVPDLGRSAIYHDGEWCPVCNTHPLVDKQDPVSYDQRESGVYHYDFRCTACSGDNVSSKTTADDAESVYFSAEED